MWHGAHQASFQALLGKAERMGRQQLGRALQPPREGFGTNPARGRDLFLRIGNIEAFRAYRQVAELPALLSGSPAPTSAAR
jgi:hypothetical protein